MVTSLLLPGIDIDEKARVSKRIDPGRIADAAVPCPPDRIEIAGCMSQATLNAASAASADLGATTHRGAFT
jgi:hypothetical protein